MIILGNIVITEFTNAELYRNLDTDSDTLYFEGIAEADDSDEKQKMALGRIPNFGTKSHSPINDCDLQRLQIKKEYEKSVGIQYDNEALLYTLEQLSSATLGIDEINNKELPDNISIIKTKYNVIEKNGLHNVQGVSWLPMKLGEHKVDSVIYNNDDGTVLEYYPAHIIIKNNDANNKE